MTSISKLQYAEALLPPKLRSALGRTGRSEREQITELRLRNGRFFSAVLYGREYFITYDGRFMNTSDNAVSVCGEDICFTFTAAFKGSVHSFPRELAQGYITCEGGNRVGFCGTAVCDTKTYEVKSVKNISSINIRIAREVIGCSQQIFQRAFADGPASLIIASPPCGGKTTVLRDLCRSLSEFYRLSVIDERGEIASVYEGQQQNDVGLRCDIFDSYKKSDAVMTAVRVMSPQMIVCDEIGSKEELQELEYAVNSGVKLICTCHASSIGELKKRPVVSRLIKLKAFDYAAILGTGSLCGKLNAFYDLSGEKSEK
ncbi:MAG: stage III sporulation protein AA [Oscillospiraceae bacterium]